MNTSSELTLYAPRLFDGERFQGARFVTVEGDRIVRVSRQHASGQMVLDLGPESALLPGLINAHSHVSIVPALGDQLGQLRLPASEQLARARRNMAVELASGVTTLRVMGQEWGVDFSLAGEIDAGRTPGPELLCAGRHLTKPGRHGHAITSVRSSSSLEALSLDNIRKGARLLKVFVSGGISSSTTIEDCPFQLSELRQVVELAHRHHLPVAAHAIAGHGIDLALEAGIDSLEHASALTAAQLERVLELDRAVVATFSILFHPRGIEAEARQNPELRRKLAAYRPRVLNTWRRILQSGARVAVGTDSVHGTLHCEIEMLIRLGASPEQALKAATSAAAEICGLPDRGRIQEGLRADLIAIQGDPAVSKSLKHPLLVIQKGRLTGQGVSRHGGPLLGPMS